MSDDAAALGVAQEAIVRAVHGSRGALADAVATARRAAERATNGRAVMDDEATAAYVKMVTFPRKSDAEVLVARPGFVLMYGLTPIAREAERGDGRMGGRNGGRRRVGEGGMTTSVSLSVVSVDVGERSEAPAPVGAVNVDIASGHKLTYAEKLEAALEKTMRSAERAEQEQSKLEEFTRQLDDFQAKISAQKRPPVRTDLSDMPSFTLDEEALVFKGDENDRKELLAHKKWVEQEMARLEAEKLEWIKEKRAATRRKSRQLDSGSSATLQKLKEQVQAARSAASKALAQATSDAKHLDTLRSRANTAQQREAEMESRQKEREALRDRQRKERLAKRTQEQAERDERKLREKEQRAQEAARKKAAAARYPMDDEELVEFDAEEAKAQGREPWPAVAQGIPWEVTEVDVAHMEICEFINTFGRMLVPRVDKMDVLTLRDVLDDHNMRKLATLYESLLRVALTSVSHLYKAQVELWQSCLDAGSFPEIIRQYAKVKSRIGGIDDTTLRLVGLLKSKVIGLFLPDEHAKLVAWLCKECCDAPALSKEIDERLANMSALRRNRQREDSQAAEFNKEYKKALESASMTIYEAHELIAQAGGESTAESAESQRLVEAQNLVDLVRQNELELEKQRGIDKTRAEQNETNRVRAACLGQDRNGTQYFWRLANDSSALIASHKSGEWSRYVNEDQVLELLKSLNEKGVRELRLAKNIRKVQNNMIDALVKAESEVALPKTSLRMSNPEGWESIAVRETLAMETTRHNIALMMHDLMDQNALAPDGTMRGWSIWSRDLNRETSLTELVRYLFQIEETLLELSPEIKKGHDISAEGSAIATAVAKVRLHSINEANLDAEISDDYDYEWWELIIPDDDGKKRRAIWKFEERPIWREAMSTATSCARVAYGAAMLRSYSRDLIASLKSRNVRAVRDASRNSEYGASRGSDLYYSY